MASHVAVYGALNDRRNVWQQRRVAAWHHGIWQ